MTPKPKYPPPLTPPEANLRSWPDLKLGITQLLDSEFNLKATDAEFRAAINLWCRAWHQVPAGSIPAGDHWQCRAAGLGTDLDRWHRVRKIALRGFVKCSDGRLYHRELCKKVLEALEFSRKQAARAGARTHGRTTQGIDFIDAENSLERKKEGKKETTGEGDDGTKGQRSLLIDSEHPNHQRFPQWYAIFPKKVARARAERAFLRVIRDKLIGFDELMTATKLYAASVESKDPQFIPHPATWLNDHRFVETFSTVSTGEVHAGGDDALVRNYFAQAQWSDDGEKITGWLPKPKRLWRWLGTGTPGEPNCNVDRAVFDRIADELKISATDWKRGSQ